MWPVLLAESQGRSFERPATVSLWLKMEDLGGKSVTEMKKRGFDLRC